MEAPGSTLQVALVGPPGLVAGRGSELHPQELRELARKTLMLAWDQEGQGFEQGAVADKPWAARAAPV